MSSNDPVVEALEQAIQETRQQLQKYEEALTLVRNGGAPETPAPRATRAPARRSRRSTKRVRGLSQERLAEIERVVRELAAEQPEFRQVDVRQRVGISSSVAALAFAGLEKAGVVKSTRKEGNSKYYSLA